jgi:hypothetical protein
VAEGTSYIPPVKRKWKIELESIDGKQSIFRINLSLQPKDGFLFFRRISHFDEPWNSSLRLSGVLRFREAIHHP